MLSVTALAGELSNALKNSRRTFLYIYTPECEYCKKFNPVYEKTSKKFNNECKFVKLNAYSIEGFILMQQLKVQYVPFVVMMNNENKKATGIDPVCLLSYDCMDKTVGSFVK